MRLTDLDQQIFVPITDETKGGATYEVQMTVADFFDKFFDGFKPEVVDAIPVSWLNDKMLHTPKELSIAAWRVLNAWRPRNEQGGKNSADQ